MSAVYRQEADNKRLFQTETEVAAKNNGVVGGILERVDIFGHLGQSNGRSSTIHLRSVANGFMIR